MPLGAQSSAKGSPNGSPKGSKIDKQSMSWPTWDLRGRQGWNFMIFDTFGYQFWSIFDHFGELFGCQSDAKSVIYISIVRHVQAT